MSDSSVDAVDSGRREDTRSATMAWSGEPIDGPSYEPGARIGRYLLISELGRGGMGIVHRAYDPKLQREVALKVVRGAAMLEAAQARFVREAQAMAKLSHPNVVAVYDVERTDAGVVLAMEYVDGPTLSKWLEAPRAWRAIVLKLIEAGRGLHAAHSAGLLHRDFKPSNVLVGRDGRARVGDFGLACAGHRLEREETDDGSHSLDEDRLTQAGDIVGTPAYMSPEQLAGEPLTAASDQYALCVSLWEALNSKLPIPTKGIALRELIERKRGGAPSWPKRRDVPRPVVEAIRRGLAGDPAARWSDVGSLLAALDYDPLAVTRRRRLGLAATSVFFVGGASAAAVLGAEHRRCTGGAAAFEAVWNDARREAVRRAIDSSELPYASRAVEEVELRLDRYRDAWTEQHEESCLATSRGEQSERLLDLRMACLGRARDAVAGTIEVLSEGDAAVTEHADDLLRTLPELERCADADQLDRDAPPLPPELATAVEAARRRLAEIHRMRAVGRVALASRAIDELLHRVEALAEPRVLAEVLLERGHIRYIAGQHENIEFEFRRAMHAGFEAGAHHLGVEAALRLARIIDRPDRRAEARDLLELAAAVGHGRGLEARQVIDVHHARAELLASQGAVEAQREYEAALALANAGGEPLATHVATIEVDFAQWLLTRKRTADAEALLRKALATRVRSFGTEHPATATTRNRLAGVLAALGRSAEAETEYRRAMTAYLEVFGPAHNDTLAVRNNLATLLQDLGRHDAAVVEIERAIAEAQAADPNRDGYELLRLNLGYSLSELGRHEDAARECDAVIGAFLEGVGETSQYAAQAHNLHASILAAAGHDAEALAAVERAAAIASDLGPGAADTLGQAEHLLGSLWLERGDLARAETHWRRAVATRERLGPDAHLRLAESRMRLGALLAESGRLPEALTLLEAAHRAFTDDVMLPVQHGQTAFALAKAVHGTNRDEARVRELAAVATVEFMRAGQPDRAAEVTRWLAGLDASK